MQAINIMRTCTIKLHCSAISSVLHLNLILREEESSYASAPVLHKCGVGYHLIMDPRKSNSSQKIIPQLNQPASNSCLIHKLAAGAPRAYNSQVQPV